MYLKRTHLTTNTYLLWILSKFKKAMSDRKQLTLRTRRVCNTKGSL